MTQPNDDRQFGGLRCHADRREEKKIKLRTRQGVERRIVLLPRPDGTWLLQEQTHEDGNWRTAGSEVVEYLHLSGFDGD
jgi:hypothetical protein